MERLVIGVDIDGVIADLGTAMLPLLSEVCSRPVAYHDLSSWDLGQALSIDEVTMKRTWEQLFFSDALRYAPPIDGAIDSLSTLSEHEIWLVTSRPISTQDLTISWLHDNRVHYDQIVFNRRGDKLSVGPTFNIFIEDYLDEIITITEAGIFALLFDQPWNQTSRLPANCERVYDWNNILQSISNLNI
ncbi:hypothetical protein ACFLTQ_00145 [Chloroflexota bacterium]